MLTFPGINPVDYLLIGHITRDRTASGYQIGGSVAYAGLTAQALGMKAGVVTSWGEDTPLTQFDGIAIANNPVEHSTTFENNYTPEGRKQYLLHRAEELAYYHIPESWRQARIVHLAPVAQEVQATILRHFPDAYLFLTPQGWHRQWGTDGLVSPTEWPEARYILQQAHAVVLSEEDIGGSEEIISAYAAATPILVITRGAAGASIYTEGEQYSISAPKVEEVDPTGAGDIFAAAFFTYLTQSGDPISSAERATRIASDSVTRVGLDGVPTADFVSKISTEV